ncbi:MAG: DUF4321 domain-containing protein [Oscillospiraceae bacterium]|jgi:hypothetical protein|nr:DUF4321 domain-containing protein [Oscillospiraceae bacterium]
MGPWKKSFYWLASIIISIVVGNALAPTFSGTAFSWLAQSANFGFDPIAFNLTVVKFSFGLMFTVNACQAAIFVICAIVYYFINRD